MAATANAAVDVEIGVGIAEWVGSELGRCAGVAVGLGIGIDAVGIRELANMVESGGPSFMDMCWTSAEQAYCAGSIPRLAARWAAKEATMKALGHGIGELDPKEIEVVSAEGVPPSLQLHGGAAALARNLGVGHLAVSLTHEANLAIAFVVAKGDGFDTEPGTAAPRAVRARRAAGGSSEPRD